MTPSRGSTPELPPVALLMRSPDQLVLERAAQLVGGDTVIRSLAGAEPQRILIVSRFQRRVGVINLAIGAFVVFRRIEQILVQRLAVNRQTLAASLGDGCDPGAGRNVHHVERGAWHAFG